MLQCLYNNLILEIRIFCVLFLLGSPFLFYQPYHTWKNLKQYSFHFKCHLETWQKLTIGGIWVLSPCHPYSISKGMLLNSPLYCQNLIPLQHTRWISLICYQIEHHCLSQNLQLPYEKQHHHIFFYLLI